MTETSSRGRPAKPESELREVLFAAMFAILDEKGAGALSVDEIARKSKVAKKTIYKYFANKETLVEAMIVAWTSTEVLPALALPASKEEVIAQLRLFFVALAARVLSRESVAIYRFLQHDSEPKQPLIALYRKHGIENATRMLDEWFHAVRETGLLSAAWPENGGYYLQSMIVTPLLRDISLGMSASGTEAHISAVVARVLKDFTPLLLSR